MLEIRPTCENCNKSLPPDSTEALICTFECTWCTECNENILKNVCPNCGGGLQKRPVRPVQQLMKHPASEKNTFNPVDMTTYLPLRKKLRDIPPENR